MKRLEIHHAETKAIGERDHEKEMKRLDIKHDESKAAVKIAEQEAKMQVCEVFRCYWKESFNILIKGNEARVWGEEGAEYQSRKSFFRPSNQKWLLNLSIIFFSHSYNQIYFVWNSNKSI